MSDQCFDKYVLRIFIHDFYDQEHNFLSLSFPPGVSRFDADVNEQATFFIIIITIIIIISYPLTARVVWAP